MTSATTFRLGILAAQAVIVASVLLLWEYAAAEELINPLFIGQPSRILQLAIESLRDGSLLSATWVTLSETLLGFAAGIVVGSAIGLALWWSRLAGRVMEPLLVVFNAIPKIALAPIFIVLLGVGFWMKSALAFANVLALAVLTSYSGAKQADADLMDLIRSFGGSRWQAFQTIVLPSSLVWIVSTLEICLGLAFVGAVTGEFLAAREGLGYMALYGSNIFNMNVIWVAVLAMMVVTVLLAMIMRRIERHVLAWKPQHASI